MAYYKGATILLMATIFAVSLALTSAAASKEDKSDAKKSSDAKASQDDGRLFFNTGSTLFGTGTDNTSVTISNDLLLLLSLLLVAGIVVAIVVPISVTAGVYKKKEEDYYSGSGYASAPAFDYGHDASSYSSIHRTLEDAAVKYH